MAGVPPAKRRALASHDSLQYIASAYGITLLTVNGWTNKSEPSAAELAKLAQRIRAERVKALFLDSITDPRAMQRIAGETGSGHRRHALRRFASRLPAAKLTATSRCCATTWRR